MREFNGKFVKVLTHDNKYFDNIVKFVLEHFDDKRYIDTVILISTTINHTVEEVRKLHPDKRVIVYNWEQLVGNNNYINIEKYIANMKGADEVWDYDELNAKYLSWHKVEVDRIEPFRYTESLVEVANYDKPAIDVLLFGYMNDVRANKLAYLSNQLYHDYSIVSVSGMDRDRQSVLIGESKIILNLHGMEPYVRQEQERISYGLINSKCILSEPSQINYFGEAIVERPLNLMKDTIIDLLKDDKWKEVAENGYNMFKNNNCKVRR